MDGFDWLDSDNKDIVVETRKAIAVYAADKGHVVIRQESFVDHEEDQVVLIYKDTIPALIAKLQTFLE